MKSNFILLTIIIFAGLFVLNCSSGSTSSGSGGQIDDDTSSGYLDDDVADDDNSDDDSDDDNDDDNDDTGDDDDALEAYIELVYGGGAGYPPGYINTVSLVYDYFGNGYFAVIKGGWLFLYTIHNDGSFSKDFVATYAAYPSIALDMDNNLHISYLDTLDHTLNYSTNESGKWVIVKVDDINYSYPFSSIAIGSDNIIHIVYHYNSSDKVKYAFYSSGQWHYEVIYDASDVQFSYIKTDSQDIVYIAFINGMGEIYLATGSYNNWNMEKVISDAYVNFSFTIDMDSHAHISYDTYPDVQIKYATNSSGSWVSETVSIGGGLMGALSFLGIDSKGYGHIAHQTTDYWGDHLVYSTNSSGTWSNEFIYPEGNVYNFGPLTLDKDDNIYISFINEDNQHLLYMSNKNGLWKWNNLDTEGFTDPLNSTKIDVNGNIHVSYSGYSNRGPRYAVRKSGVWHQEAVDSVDSVGHSTSLALDSNNNPHIIYTSYDIYQPKEKSAHEDSLWYAKKVGDQWIIEKVNDRCNTIGNTSLALDKNDKAHLLCQNSSNESNSLIYANNTSGVWSAVDIDEQSDDFDSCSSITIDQHDFAHIGFNDRLTESIKYATNKTGAWVKETIETGSLTGCTHIVLDSNANPHVCYYIDGYFKYAHKTNGTWTSVIMEETVGGFGEGERNNIKLDQNEKVHFVYSSQKWFIIKYATYDQGIITNTSIDTKGLIDPEISFDLGIDGNIHTICGGNGGIWYSFFPIK